ncbi:hypothetical protein P8452_03624 [Trifolium repens]|nr:hypothetical protein P8452_03624 [Trifolium repens]
MLSHLTLSRNLPSSSLLTTTVLPPSLFLNSPKRRLSRHRLASHSLEDVAPALGGVTADGSHPHHPLSRSVGLVDCWLIRRDLPSVPTEPPGFTAGSRDSSPLGWDPRRH